MIETKVYCDHCKKPLDKEDYFKKPVGCGPMLIEVDSCRTCMGKFIAISEKYWNGEEFKRVDL